MIAVVAVFGVAWMADTVFDANLPAIKDALSDVVKTKPWTYAIALLIVSKLVNSQAAAIALWCPSRCPSAFLRGTWSPSRPPATVITSYRRIHPPCDDPI
jgi:hypothetical protein